MFFTGTFFFISSLISLAVLVLLVKFLLLGIKYYERELGETPKSKKSE